MTARHARRYSKFKDVAAGILERHHSAAGWEPKHRRLSLAEFGTAITKAINKGLHGTQPLVQSDLTRAR